jgi:hypothetical protein
VLQLGVGHLRPITDRYVRNSAVCDRNTRRGGGRSPDMTYSIPALTQRWHATPSPCRASTPRQPRPRRSAVGADAHRASWTHWQLGHNGHNGSVRHAGRVAVSAGAAGSSRATASLRFRAGEGSRLCDTRAVGSQRFQVCTGSLLCMLGM